MLNQSINLALAVFLILLHTSMAGENRTITVALIGDSTVTEKSGWGKAFADRFDEGVITLNFAVGGRSSKSWYDEGRLPEVLAAKPDYVFIQFGHNDQPGKGPERETDPETSYRENLKRYIIEFRSIGAKPLLLSSVSRRKFNTDGQIDTSLTPWANAARSVAEEMEVPFLDLHALSVSYHNIIGYDASMAFNPEDSDTTHFNELGAEIMADLLISLLRSQDKAIPAYLN